MSYFPYKGDTIYVDDTKLPEYGERGVIIKSVETRVYNYDADYDHTVRLDSGKTIVLDQDQVSFKKGAPRSERVAKRQARARADEVANLKADQKRINARLKELES